MTALEAYTAAVKAYWARDGEAFQRAISKLLVLASGRRIHWRDVVETLIKDQGEDMSSSRPRIIMLTVAEYYGLTVEHLLGPKQCRDVARPRQMAMAITREMTPLSLPAIGRFFGPRDHTTVLHGIRQVAKYESEAPGFASQMAELRILCERALKQAEGPIVAKKLEPQGDAYEAA